MNGAPSPVPSAAPWWTRLRQAVAAYREQNLRELAEWHPGWHDLVARIYAEHFAARHRGKFDQRRQTWQKYGK